MSDTPLLALTLGDPAGIGPEIALRLLAAPPTCARLLLLGDRAALERELPHVPGASLPPEVGAPEEVPDRPGGLADVMELFDREGVNIEYLYSSLERNVDNAVVIFKVENLEHGMKICQSSGLPTVSSF